MEDCEPMMCCFCLGAAFKCADWLGKLPRVEFGVPKVGSVEQKVVLRRVERGSNISGQTLV